MIVKSAYNTYAIGPQDPIKLSSGHEDDALRLCQVIQDLYLRHVLTIKPWDPKEFYVLQHNYLYI